MTESIKSFRGEMKKSRFKIWLRAALFVIFGSLFTVYFFRDIAHGYFTWGWAALLFVFFIPVGFLLSRIVPMQADLESKAVTLSLDKLYLVLIWVLVIAKLIASHIPSLVTISDVIMCVILGIMFGRLGGIGLRVRQFKIQHGFADKQLYTTLKVSKTFRVLFLKRRSICPGMFGGERPFVSLASY